MMHSFIKVHLSGRRALTPGSPSFSYDSLGMLPFGKNNLSFSIVTLLLVLLLSSCTGTSIKTLAAENGFVGHCFNEGTFDVQGYLRGEASLLRVYIEGDGKAWLSRSRPSSDPTPDTPVSFHLAVADNHPAVFYMARPCQFVEGDNRRNCIMPFWTSARFSEPVIHDLNQMLDKAKSMANAQRLELVGYSGGGAVALLLAARRDDVSMVITIAGNLDHVYWTNLHKVSPLRDSLNPADYVAQTQMIKQVHIVSTDDSVIPPSVVQSYMSHMTDPSKTRIVTVSGVEHTGAWDTLAPGILRRINRSE